MRLASIISEAWRNTATATTRPLIFALALIISAGGLALADTATLAALHHQAVQFHVSGGSTYILSADRAVSGVACDRLSQIDGIEASGALRTARNRLDVAALPGASIPILETTSAFGDVIGLPALRIGGIALSPDVADTLGTQRGDTVTLTGDKKVTVNGVFDYPNDGRLQALRYSVLSPVVAEDTFDQCWATIWPPSPDTKNLLNTTITGDAATSDLAIGQLNNTHGATFDGPALFAQRLTAWAPALSAIAAFILGLLSVRLRRLELASALHARVSRTALLTQLSLETAFWALPAVLTATAATAIASAVLAPESSTEILNVALRSVAIAAPAGILGTIVSGLLTRERDLFKYFKER